jgi:hypothetical protein
MFAVCRGHCLNNVLCFAMFSLAVAVSRFVFDVRNTTSNLNCMLVDLLKARARAREALRGVDPVCSHR